MRSRMEQKECTIMFPNAALLPFSYIIQNGEVYVDEVQSLEAVKDSENAKEYDEHHALIAPGLIQRKRPHSHSLCDSSPF